MKNKVSIICLSAALALPGLMAANTDARPSGERRKPPQAAFDACKDKSEGASVEITTPGGTLKATCKSFEGQLVAVPEGAPTGPPPGESGSR